MAPRTGNPPDGGQEGKYVIHAAGAQGVVVGDNTRVEQHFHRAPTARPCQSPPLPAYFVPRPEVSARVQELLRAEAPAGALVVSAIPGLGGIGKTVLAAALAHDPAVQERLPAGVLWATRGQ